MAAYENLPGFVGQKFQTEYLSRKLSKPAVQKSIAKVSSVPLRAFHLSSVEGWVIKFAVVPVAQ
jgi:hypothetical protein